MAILERALIYNQQIEGDARISPKSAIEVLQLLVLYTQYKPRPGNSDILEPLRSLVASVVAQLENEELFASIAALLVEVLELCNSFFSHSMILFFAEKLTHQSYQTHVQQLINGDFSEDNVLYGGLLIAYGESKVDDIVLQRGPPANDKIVEMLGSLIRSSGYAVADDPLTARLMEFWSNYVETALTHRPSNMGENRAQWLQTAERNTQLALDAFLPKIQLPPPQLLLEWDRQTYAEFQALRGDFRDLSASAYSLVGASLLKTLVSYTVPLWQGRQWKTVEIVLQCIIGILEVAEETEEADRTLTVLFHSSLLNTIGSQDEGIPGSTQRAVVQLVTDSAEFFKRHTTSLPPILNFLFRCLQNKFIMLPSSRAISGLCDHCRKELIELCEGLSNYYCNLVSTAVLPLDVKEKLIGGVGSVVQASWPTILEVPDSSSQAMRAWDKLFESIMADSARSSQDPSTTEGYESALSAVRCLASFAKAFRSPEEKFIDLVNDLPSLPEPIMSSRRQRDRRSRLCRILTEALRLYPRNGEIMESVCNVVRAGITEEEPNPFALVFQTIENSLLISVPHTTRIGYLLETVSMELRRLGKRFYTADISRTTRWLEASYQVLAAAKRKQTLKLSATSLSATSTNGNSASERRPRDRLKRARLPGQLLPVLPRSPLRLRYGLRPRLVLRHSNNMPDPPRNAPQAISRIFLGK